MLSVLLAGKLTSPPEKRQGRSNTPFAMAKMRVTDTDGAYNTVLLTAFDAAAADLLMLEIGDALTVAGEARLTMWTDNEGEKRPSLQVRVDNVQTAYKSGKKRRFFAAENPPPPPQANQPALFDTAPPPAFLADDGKLPWEE